MFRNGLIILTDGGKFRRRTSRSGLPKDNWNVEEKTAFQFIAISDMNVATIDASKPTEPTVDLHRNLAIKKLVGYVGSSKEKTRMAVLDTVGGRFQVVASDWLNRGKGIVEDRSLVKPLAEMYGMESKGATKKKIIRAIGYIKSLNK